jgi:hypothetical protein
MPIRFNAGIAVATVTASEQAFVVSDKGTARWVSTGC